MQAVTYLDSAWQGQKKSARRPGVVRKIRDGQALIMPCTTSVQYSGKDAWINIPVRRDVGFHRFTKLVMNYGERKWVSLRTIQVINPLPDDIAQQVLAWEHVHTVWHQV